MTNPAILCESGISYQRSNIERWIETYGYSAAPYRKYSPGGARWMRMPYILVRDCIMQTFDSPRACQATPGLGRQCPSEPPLPRLGYPFRDDNVLPPRPVINNARSGPRLLLDPRRFRSLISTTRLPSRRDIVLSGTHLFLIPDIRDPLLVPRTYLLRSTDPATRRPLADRRLLPNPCLRALVAAVLPPAPAAALYPSPSPAGGPQATG